MIGYSEIIDSVYFLSVSNTDVQSYLFVAIGKGNSLGYSFYLTEGKCLLVQSVKGITIVGGYIACSSWSFTLMSFGSSLSVLYFLQVVVRARAPSAHQSCYFTVLYYFM